MRLIVGIIRVGGTDQHLSAAAYETGLQFVMECDCGTVPDLVTALQLVMSPFAEMEFKSTAPSLLMSEQSLVVWMTEKMRPLFDALFGGRVAVLLNTDGGLDNGCNASPQNTHVFIDILANTVRLTYRD
jgi:hypothetical protein